MTTIAVFGASGRTGRRVVQRALAGGATVRALVRTPEKFQLKSPQLTVIAGDVLDAAAVDQVVTGSDAVISVFGHAKNSPPDLQTEGTRNIVAAMTARGVTRIVSLSGGGLPAPQDRPKLADKVIRFLLRRLSPQVLDDAIAHHGVLADSSVDWTIVRGPRLAEGSARGSYRVGWVGVNASTQIDRDDLADFILTQVTDTTFVRQLPFVSR